MSLAGPSTADLTASLRLVDVAQGKQPADLYVSGGQVLNVYTGEIIKANIAVSDERIAYVGLQETMVGPNTRKIDASGSFLVPGYVNAHDHGDVLSTPTTHSMEALRRGTTTIFYNGRHLPFFVSPSGYRRIIEELADLPTKLYFGVETAEGAYRIVADRQQELDTVAELLSSDRIFGLHEVVRWTDVLAGDAHLLQKLTLALQAGKTVEGHTAGASYDKLAALAASGYQSCHESINLQDVLNRLRLGLYVMLRCSTIRPDDLPDMLRSITEMGLSSNRLMLVPDGMVPSDDIEKGNMDYLVDRTIAAGVDPITAYQMATINPATHFGMDGEIGGIAPRRWADILFLTDLSHPTPFRVLSKGVIVADEGRLTVDFPQPQYYRWIQNKFGIAGSAPVFTPATFETPADGATTFPVIEMVSNVINRRLDLALPARAGLLQASPNEDILHVALVARASGRITRGFIKGFGARIGGLAATADGNQEMIVIGGDPAQMAAAASRVWELQGGIVLMDREKRVFELPLPVGGMLSPEPLPVLAGKLQEIARLLEARGFPHGELHYAIGTLTWYFLPQLRLTAEGILDVRQGKIIIPSAPFA